MANPLRNCLACGQTDDHPRCVNGLPDGSSVYYHHDCHARMDPPCPSCEWLVEHKGQLTGDQWREHVQSLHEAMSDEQLELHPHERDVVGSHADGKVKKGR